MSTEDILREQVKELNALVDLKDARIAELGKKRVLSPAMVSSPKDQFPGPDWVRIPLPLTQPGYPQSGGAYRGPPDYRGQIIGQAIGKVYGEAS